MSARILTAGGTWITDDFRVIRDADETIVDRLALLPLARYLAHPQPAHVGVWLGPTDDPAALGPHLEDIPLIAVDFPKFTDGRGYSSAALLRRAGYRGDLRAIGDVLVDQIFFLKRVGFTSFALRADQDPAIALRALRTYSDAYQGAYDQRLPTYRRCARPHASGPSTTAAT